MKKRVFGRLGALVVAGVATSAVVAAIAFAAAGGGTPAKQVPVAGTVKLSDNATPFSVSSFQFGAGIGINNDDPPQFSDPSLSEFTFSKGFDGNSVTLLNALVGKTVFPKVVFTATWGSGATLSTLVYEMTNAAVSGDSVSSGGEQPNETFSLHFTHLKWTLTD